MSITVMKTPTLFYCLLLAFQLHAQQPTDPTAELKTKLHEVALQGWSGSVLVAMQGRILVESGYGLADREANRAQTAETIFSVGSITKQFTAAGIMKLESTGKLSLDDPLSHYFPDVPADKVSITVHHLLTHSAGFEGAIGDDYDTIDAAAFLRLAFGRPLLFTPGTAYEYSNVGYSILGILTAHVSGQSYEDFCFTHLWSPARMMQTGYLRPQHSKENLAVGYRHGQRWGTALDRPWPSDGPGWHLCANGGVLSSVGDMYLWYLALKDYRVLPPGSIKKMCSPHVAEDPEGRSFYGYGWVVQQIAGKEMIWHNGGNGVYNAFMGMIPEDDICIIVSSNSNNVVSDDIALQILGILWGKELRVPPQEPPYRNNPVTQTILHAIRVQGADVFMQNAEAILRDAGFDFENDMQLLGVGEQLMEAQQWKEAISLYQVYTNLFPHIVVAWNHLGLSQKSNGNLSAAKAAWEQSVSLRPQNNPAVQWLREMQ